MNQVLQDAPVPTKFIRIEQYHLWSGNISTSCTWLRYLVNAAKEYPYEFNGLVFFQNEGIFVQLDELDELDKITHA